MRTVLRGLGESCVTAGAVVVLFLAYLLWGTAQQASQHQHAFASQLQRERYDTKLWMRDLMEGAAYLPKGSKEGSRRANAGGKGRQC